MEPPIENETLKQIVRESLLSIMEEKPDYFREIVEEIVEDQILGDAMKRADLGSVVPEAHIRNRLRDI